MGIWAIACICWVSFCGGLLLGGGGLFLGMRGMEVFEREIERQTEKRHKKIPFICQMNGRTIQNKLFPIKENELQISQE